MGSWVNILTDCCTFWAQLLSVVVCGIFPRRAGRPGSGQPRGADARQHRRIVPAAVAARTEFREEIREHVAPAVSQRIIGNRLLAVGFRSRVPLARLPLIPVHRQARIFWCCFCMRVMGVHVYSVDMMRVIFLSAFAHDTTPNSGILVWGRSVKIRDHIWCFCKVK